ncbi:unnamed protein product [Amoebophrya sp. A25]|nr:unnamed protein product [Amoebophrya sp. A25]|eukprot:GSA25T00024197001.1
MSVDVLVTSAVMTVPFQVARRGSYLKVSFLSRTATTVGRFFTTSSRTIDISAPRLVANQLHNFQQPSSTGTSSSPRRTFSSSPNINEKKMPATIFDKILDKEIPSECVYEDDVCYAFNDISAQAPIHFLVIPKARDIPRISEADEKKHKEILGHCMYIAGKVGREKCGEDGFRVVVNDGEKGGQTVYHLHLHVLGGRQLTWPPG